MKLIRLKINDPDGFRGLHCGFELDFRTDWTLQEELEKREVISPFVCAGPNGSGKSNLLEALSAIFFQLELRRVRSNFLPETLQDETLDFQPTAFELDYLIQVPREYRHADSPRWAKVSVWKERGESVRYFWDNQGEFETDTNEAFGGGYADILLPEYVLGYSSGENEILSLPFFKTRFIQFDEYWDALTRQSSYSGRPDTRLAYLDNSFSQAILLCNLLFQDEETLTPFREDIGVESLTEFRILIRRSILIPPEYLETFASEDENKRQTIDEIIDNNSALGAEEDDNGEIRYRLNLTHLLEGDERSSRIISALKRCATLYYLDEDSDTLILDYWVDENTLQAFQENFDYSALSLFQALQVLLTLNLYPVSDILKNELYRSSSHYVSETVPTLASDERIMRFKNFYFTKQGVRQPMLLKELSDGEHQLLHSLGLCLLFRDTNSLFLLDEPETHFNPEWRANFISRLRQCFPKGDEKSQEILITTHSPFLISDSRPEKVLVFSKEKRTGEVSIRYPDYNTLGASINKITMNTFGKRETIGAYAKEILDQLRHRFESGEEDTSKLIDDINRELGDSVEKILLVKAILDKQEGQSGEVQD